MTVLPIFRSRCQRPAGLAGALAGLATLALLASGCDSAVPGTSGQKAVAVQHEGLSYRAVGGAKFALEQGRLQVFSPEATGGVAIETEGRLEGNFHFRVSGIPDGRVFSMTLVGEGGKPLAHVLHHETARRMHPLSVDLSGLGAERFTLELRKEGEVLYRRENQRLASDTTTLIARSSEDPDSYHYETKIIDGEKVTVVKVDYNGKQTSSEGALVAPATEEDISSFHVTHVTLIPESDRQPLPTAEVESVRLVGPPSITFEKPLTKKSLRLSETRPRAEGAAS